MTGSSQLPPVTIRIRGLVKRFAPQGAEAIKNVTTEMRWGQITGLVGPDGAGKSTLIRMMAGLLHPTQGEIRVNGLDPRAQSGALREIIGYMPQKFGLYEELSVMENLSLYADLRNVTGVERDQGIESLLHFTDLARFTGRPAGKLSGGMKQKLGLACSLLGSPKVLLLDEPGVGIDPISRRELWKMVRKLSSTGMTVVWSTAYLDEAELCDEVRLMAHGEIKAGGPPRVLMDRMRGRSLRITGIWGNRRALLGRALASPQVMDGVIQGSSVRILLRQAGELPCLEALQAGAGASLVEAPPRLEDAFISILGGGPGGESALAAQLPLVELPPEVDPHAVIRAHRLTKRFGDFTATRDVSFTVARGEIFGLLGPNGAGKSTIFKMKCGLLKPTSGQATVMGIDLTSSPSKARQRLGYMAQKFSLYKQLSVGQNLEFFSGIYGLAGEVQREKIARMVELFNLRHYLDSPADELPLGFKQRLALACAVMHEPQILFLDEPTSGVDPVTRREFWNHINGVAEKGVTVMVTTHFMDEAEYCDRIGIVYRGELIALGTPDQLKERVASPGNPDPTMEDAFIRLVREADR